MPASACKTSHTFQSTFTSSVCYLSCNFIISNISRLHLRPHAHIHKGYQSLLPIYKDFVRFIVILWKLFRLLQTTPTDERPHTLLCYNKILHYLCQYFIKFDPVQINFGTFSIITPTRTGTTPTCQLAIHFDTFHVVFMVAHKLTLTPT